jgi:ribonucleoside-diphosphate reductase alpha chain
MDSELCYEVWADKYRWQEETYTNMFKRVANGVYALDAPGHAEEAFEYMKRNLWMPAGRILAGAGTPKRVTLLNCFVNAKLEDDMASITQGIGNAMLTQQQGGGIGTDFSPLRPPGAILRRTGSTASGPGPFVDVFDAAGTTIRSAGDRRGAQMGTLICTHPYLPEFIRAKQTAGKWTNFNVSVLVTDAFMGAVAEDEDWLLHHAVPPATDRSQHLVSLDFTDDTNTTQYVYSVWRARDLWDMILRGTYEYAEPGVIFIDRVNDLNNLGYCEDIQCTNPCGEQPLPPHGCCDLGAVMLSRMVRQPFTEDAEFDWTLLKNTARVGTRFLDNVINVTNYPLPEQREEEFAKRRIGIGFSGLADAMHFLGMRYGSPRSCDYTEKVARELCHASYRTSIELAKEKGPFPLFDRDKYMERPFIAALPEDIKQGIFEHGIRNGVLGTIAPTGTTSIAYGNGSSGLEPVFSHSMRRKVRQGDNTFKEYTEVAYGARVYMSLNPGSNLDDLPKHMNVCADVRIHEHIRIQEVTQKYIDASISKTINLPTEIPYEDFKDVYQLAYDSGLKGCTTYRPSDVRGSILEVGGDTPTTETAANDVTRSVGRPEIVDSRTIKVSWAGLTSSLYLTVGYVDGKPWEIFLNSKDQKSLEWTMALTILMSQSLRHGVPLESLANEFLQISALEGGWAEGSYWPSLVAYLGHKLKSLVEEDKQPFTAEDEADDTAVHGSGASGSEVGLRSTNTGEGSPKMGQCPDCHQFKVTSLGGCPVCENCGWSKCS